jgi:hypothetical protein
VDPRPLVTASMAVMTVIHFAKVSTMYPRVVISLLAKQLEKPAFCHSCTSFGSLRRDHYLPLQRFTMCHMPSLAKVVRVIHFAKVSAMYPRVVISLLAKQLEKPPFCHSCTSFGSLLRFPDIVMVPWPLLHHVSLGE